MDTKFMVAAIDFGTTYSGWAFSFKHQYLTDPSNIQAKHWHGGQLISSKAPTCLLIHPDKETVHSFGFDAENKYADLSENNKHTEWYYFKRFKMMLFGDGTHVHRDTMLEDETGKKLPALEVFSLSVRYMKDDVMNECNKHVDGSVELENIQWVITVPAIWNDASKQFMREAAEMAGIPDGNLMIALEPEAASLFCRTLRLVRDAGCNNTIRSFPPGTKYVVLDAGGGTVDITVHQVLPDDNLRELHRPTGGAWGGMEVDKKFDNFLKEVFGDGVLTRLKNESMEDYMELFRRFEVKKFELKPNMSTKITIPIPSSIKEYFNDENDKKLEDALHNSSFSGKVTYVSGKLRISPDIVNEFFKEPVLSIIKHLSSILGEEQFQDCKTILMVGGFSSSKFLDGAVKENFPDCTCIVPDDAGSVVLKGAVIFGHAPQVITERISRFTYGHSTLHLKTKNCNHPVTKEKFGDDTKVRCCNIFSKHVTIGQTVRLGEEQKEITSHPAKGSQNRIRYKIYASIKSDPMLTTEDCCAKIGELKIPIPQKSLGRDRRYGARFIFGGTEIVVKVEDKETGEIIEHRVDFL